MRNRIRQRKKPTISGSKNRSSVWQQIKSADSRARARVNKRVRSRKGGRSMHAAIDEMHLDTIHLNWPQRMLGWLAACLLLPLSLISLWALFTLESQPQTGGYWLRLLQTEIFYFFAIGFIVSFVWHISGVAETWFLYLYVLGHEITHAIFIYIHGGKVSGIGVEMNRGKVEGGYVMTNKTNFIIALAPYFVPFWAVVLLLLFMVIGWFTDYSLLPKIMYVSIGAASCFHLLWTLWMIPQDQPDLRQNGMFFSLVFILFANIALLTLVFCAALGGDTYLVYFKRWWQILGSLIEYLQAL